MCGLPLSMLVGVDILATDRPGFVQRIDASLGSIGIFAAVAVWGALLGAPLFGRDRAPLFHLMRTVVLGGSAVSAPLLVHGTRWTWTVPLVLTVVLAWFNWMVAEAATPSRLRSTVLVALMFAMGSLGAAIGLHRQEEVDQFRFLCGVMTAWTLLGLCDLALSVLDDRPMHLWTGFAQLTLATAPFVIYVSGAANAGSASLYCACVGAGLLIGHVSEARAATRSGSASLTRQQLITAMESQQSTERAIRVAARLHDQTAALFSVESVMALLDRNGATSGDREGVIPEAERQRLLHAAREEVGRARRLATEPPVTVEPHDLAELLLPSLALIKAHVPSIRIDLRPGMRVLADGDRLVDAVRNLVLNAVEHGRATGVEVVARATYLGYELLVSDKGPGVRPGDVEAVFQRGVGSRRGGHGLPNARAALEQMGGRLELVPGRNGTVLCVELMAAPETRLRSVSSSPLVS
jgi:signal transduction histidine kinase